MIQIVGPILKTDGYGEMARQLCLGLIENGEDITIKSILFGSEPDLKNLKTEYEVLKPFIDKPGSITHSIQCLTADNFPHYKAPGAVNIGYTMWETTKLPLHWPILCNQMDMILVPSAFCRKVFIDSGVTVPVKILPVSFDPAKFDNIVPNQNLKEIIGNRLCFYSIFEWSERKNPSALFNAYYSTFGVSDNVVLLVKSYISGDEDKNKEAIQSFAERYRSQITRHGTDYPKVVCISEFLSTKQILELHKTCDVYVAPVRGEGWLIPAFDAAAAGNHVIATNFSSQTDFLDTYNPFKYQTYDLVSYQLEPVHSMHSLYTCDQRWASINMEQLCRFMRSSYESWSQHGFVSGRQDREKYAAVLKEAYNRRKIAGDLRKVI